MLYGIKICISFWPVASLHKNKKNKKKVSLQAQCWAKNIICEWNNTPATFTSVVQETIKLNDHTEFHIQFMHSTSSLLKHGSINRAAKISMQHLIA